ncbi:MAG: hypothetical protein Q7U16_05125 [Agitococcus sp.]|nr:hypothetical protein [Agitococcus sp.]
MNINKVCAIGASVIGLLIQPVPISAQGLALSKSGQTKYEGTEALGKNAPTPKAPLSVDVH